MRFKPGQPIFTLGLTSSGKIIINKCRFLRYQPADEHGQDCVIDVGFQLINKSCDIFATKAEALAAKQQEETASA